MILFISACDNKDSPSGYEPTAKEAMVSNSKSGSKNELAFENITDQTMSKETVVMSG